MTAPEPAPTHIPTPGQQGSTMSTPATASTPLIVPELVRLDAPTGSDKKDVIEYLAQVVADAGRADTPDGLATDALAREAEARLQESEVGAAAGSEDDDLAVEPRVL